MDTLVNAVITIALLYALGAQIAFVTVCRWGVGEIDRMPWLARFQRREYLYTAIFAALLWPMVFLVTRRAE
ncbi:MAG: hypothetical protein KBD50_00290 [Candidatus Pacebacteria bacterium]|nr:hypothetical protein [Candidatus Paceibacterota bacterium]